MIRGGAAFAACVAWAVLLPGVAYPLKGHPHRRPTNPIRLAYAHAVAYLHGAPCGGHVRITVGPMTRDVEAQLRGGRYGHVAKGVEPFAWSSYVPDVEPGHEDPRFFTHCETTFNVDYWWSWREIDGYWEQFCVTMIHELGNLYGWPETLEPRETTNLRDALGEEIVPPPACTHYALTYPDGHVERRPFRGLPPGLEVVIG